MKPLSFISLATKKRMGDLEARVTEVQDETMADINEKGQPPGDPPGDPPDATKLWVAKVVGTNEGGRLTPEKVLDAAFVEERLSLEFPNGEDGEPVITIGKEVLDAMNGLWKNCMIVKVLGRNIAISVLTRKLRELWKPRGAMYVMDLPRQFFLVRFDAEEEYLAALTGGPWRAFGSYLLVQGWTPEFDPLKDEIVTTPVWIRLSNIPVNFYHKSILMGISRGLGTPVKVDMTTLNLERARFARVCVGVDLRKPLKGSVMVNGERYFVSYEGLNTICSGCGLYGHMVHACPKLTPAPQPEKPTGSDNQAERAIVTVTQKTRENVTSPTENGGFTEVRQGGRRQGPPQNKVAFAAGGSGNSLGRNIREISPKDIANIAISNRFGGLEISEISAENGAVEIRSDANKENENFSLEAQKGKSIQQGKDTRFGV